MEEKEQKKDPVEESSSQPSQEIFSEDEKVDLVQPTTEEQAVGQELPPQQQVTEDFVQQEDQGGKEKEAQKTYSTVAIASNQKKMILVLLIAAMIGAVYYFVFNSGSSSKKSNDDKSKASSKEGKYIIESSVPVTAPNDEPKVQPKQVIKPPEAPPLKDPTPPPPPEPPPPAPPPPPVFSSPDADKSADSGNQAGNKQAESGSIFSPFGPSKKEEEAKKQALDNRRKVGIMVMGSGGGALSSLSGEGGKKGGAAAGEKKDASGKKNGSNDKFLGFGDGALDSNVIKKTSTDQVEATEVGDLKKMIIQGSIIHAVLETAINTDIPGVLRAIVSRDAYAEAGDAVLVPKGSRLIGTYDSNIKGGQTRVAIMWNRLIRPDGIDIQIQSAGTDQLGRAGIAGKVDSKFWTKIASAFMVSYVIPISASKAANKLAGVKNTGVTTVTNTESNSVSVQTDSNASMLQDSTKKFGDIAKQAIEDSFSTKPTITISQGTKVNILVQRDLIFPLNTNGSVIAK